jgi:hypothetical protein
VSNYIGRLINGIVEPEALSRVKRSLPVRTLPIEIKEVDDTGGAVD